MLRKICIITPGILASNPRVVKEAEALSEAGYRVHLIYTRHVDYLIENDEGILKAHPEWTYDYLDWASPGFKSKTIKYFSGLVKKASSFLLGNGLYTKNLAPLLLNRFYSWQLKKAVNVKADLYIAHYPDCAGIAYRAAKINQACFAYDAEDFHRGEDLPFSELRTIQKVEELVLPFAKYISAASPLIAEEYQKLYPQVPIVSVENMFSVKHQPVFQKISDDIGKFFWFSQTVGPKRGLEEFIDILGRTNKKNVLLTLLGNVREDYRLKLIKHWESAGLPSEGLIFLKTVPEKEIFEIASRHHFGLCLEIPRVLNKDICLSNKLYTYLLSGNYLVLSDTKAQKSFHENYPGSGTCISLRDQPQAVEQTKRMLEDLESINQTRLSNYMLGKSKLNFDIEKQVIINQVRRIWE